MRHFEQFYNSTSHHVSRFVSLSVSVSWSISLSFFCIFEHFISVGINNGLTDKLTDRVTCRVARTQLMAFGLVLMNLFFLEFILCYNYYFSHMHATLYDTVLVSWLVHNTDFFAILSILKVD